MNFLDALIIVPMIWFGYKGFRNGLVMEIIGILSIVAGVYIAARFSAWVGECIGIEGDYAASVSFVITLVAVLVITYLIGRFIDQLVKKLSLGIFNRIGGLLFGLVKIILVMSVLIFSWNRFDRNHRMLSDETRHRSLLFCPMENISLAVWPALKNLNNHIQDAI